MATRTVRVLRAFNGINKEQSDAEGAENTRYFTPSNQDTVEEFLTEKEFNYRVESGFLSIEETREPEPMQFKTPDERAAVAEAATPTATRRRKSGSEE